MPRSRGLSSVGGDGSPSGLGSPARIAPMPGSTSSPSRPSRGTPRGTPRVEQGTPRGTPRGTPSRTGTPVSRTGTPSRTPSRSGTPVRTPSRSHSPSSAASTPSGELGPSSSSTSSLAKPFVVLAMPGMYLVYKYNQFKRQQQENSRQKHAEKELNQLNQKIDKLLAKLDDHEADSEPEPAAGTPVQPVTDDECVVCMCAKATMQTFPCGHKVVCRKCFVKTIQVAVTQRRLPLRCVVCRARVLKLKQSPGAGGVPSKSVSGKGHLGRQSGITSKGGTKSTSKVHCTTMRQAQQLARDMHKKGFAVPDDSAPRNNHQTPTRNSHQTPTRNPHHTGTSTRSSSVSRQLHVDISSPRATFVSSPHQGHRRRGQSVRPT